MLTRPHTPLHTHCFCGCFFSEKKLASLRTTSSVDVRAIEITTNLLLKNSNLLWFTLNLPFSQLYKVQIYFIPLFPGINEPPLTSSTKKGAKLLEKTRKKKSHHSQSPLWSSRNHWWQFYRDKSRSNLDVLYGWAFEVQVATLSRFPTEKLGTLIFGAKLKLKRRNLSVYSKLALELQHLLPALCQRNAVQCNAQRHDSQNKSNKLCVVAQKKKKMNVVFVTTIFFWYLARVSYCSPICQIVSLMSSSLWTG